MHVGSSSPVALSLPCRACGGLRQAGHATAGGRHRPKPSLTASPCDSLLPTIDIAPATHWAAGVTPTTVTALAQGLDHHGWPYSYYGQHVDVRPRRGNPEMVARAVLPDYALGTHTASLGLAFSKAGCLLPTALTEGVFVGQHGFVGPRAEEQLPHGSCAFPGWSSSRQAGRCHDRFPERIRRGVGPHGRRRHGPEGRVAGRRRRGRHHLEGDRSLEVAARTFCGPGRHGPSDSSMRWVQRSPCRSHASAAKGHPAAVSGRTTPCEAANNYR